jgi:DNA mismatch repair ATPase MutL
VLCFSNITSKIKSIEDVNNLKTFGYRGEALYNIISISDKFEIVSRKRNFDRLVRKTIKSFTQNNKIKTLDYLNDPVFDKGTHITISNLFYNAPIKQEQLKEYDELKLIRKFFEQISLFYYDINMQVIDLYQNKTLFQAFKTNSIKMQFSNLFGSDFNNFLKPFKLEKEDFMLERDVFKGLGVQGLFSIYSHNLSLQFIYLNQYLIENKNLYAFVNKQLSVVNLYNKKKINCKYPVYVIILNCTQEFFCMNENKNNRSAFFISNDYIMRLIQKLVEKFLVLEGFRLPASNDFKTLKIPEKTDQNECLNRLEIQTTVKRKSENENMNVVKKIKSIDSISTIDSLKNIDKYTSSWNDFDDKSEKIFKTNDIMKESRFSDSIQFLDTAIKNVPKCSTQINTMYNETDNNDDFEYERKNIWYDLFTAFKPRSKPNRQKCCEKGEINDQDFQSINGLLMKNQIECKWRCKEDRSKNI